MRAMRTTLCLHSPDSRIGRWAELGHGHPGGPGSQVTGPSTEPGHAFLDHPDRVGPLARRLPRALQIRRYVDPQATARQLVGEGSGQPPVTTFARMQPVDTPEVPAIHL